MKKQKKIEANLDAKFKFSTKNPKPTKNRFFRSSSIESLYETGSFFKRNVKTNSRCNEKTDHNQQVKVLY
jgi:hypothetical protein